MASSQMLRSGPVYYRCVTSATYCSRLQCAGGTSKFALPPLAFQNRNVSLLKRASQRAALSRQKPNIGWLPRRRFGGIAAPSKENHVRMVLGSGGQQQKSSQQGSKVPTWHPLEDVAPRCQDEPVSQEGKVRGLLPAECARTVVETNEDGVLFTRLFPESHSEGLDLAYVTDDRGGERLLIVKCMHDELVQRCHDEITKINGDRRIVTLKAASPQKFALSAYPG